MHKTVPSIAGSTSLTTIYAHTPYFRRGQLLTTLFADGAERTQRVIVVSGPTLTVRPLHRWRIVEAARFAWERAIAWPCADAWRWVRA